MATGAQAITRIAAETGLLVATVSRAARTLREADPALWPMAGRGGGKAAAHVEPGHLVNLGFALTVEPITEAPDTVRWANGLVPRPVRNADVPLPGDTLGDVLAGLVDALSRPGGATRPVRIDRYEGLMFVNVEMVWRAAERSHVVVRASLIQNDRNEAASWTRYEQAGGEAASLIIPSVRSPLDRHVTLSFGFYEACAELWADSREHGAQAPDIHRPSGRPSSRRASRRA